jgi:hypothetical protein
MSPYGVLLDELRALAGRIRRIGVGSDDELYLAWARSQIATRVTELADELEEALEDLGG